MDYIDNCRLCLGSLKSQKIKLTKEMQSDYYELTNTTLAESAQYSEYACMMCCNDLKNSTLIKKKFQEIQVKLKDLIEKDLKPEVKIELKDHIKEESCVVFLNNDPLVESPFKIPNSNDDSISIEEIPKRTRNKPVTRKAVKKNGKRKPKTSDNKPLPVRLEDPEKWAKQLEFQKQKMICEFCSKFFSRNFLRKHQQAVHKKVKRYICDMCGKGVYRRECLLEHLRTHINEKIFPCDMCEKSFKSKSRMYQHKRLKHEKRYSQSCHICGVEFLNQFLLKDHIASKHTGIPRHTCSECSKSFFSQSRLQNHKKTNHMPQVLKTCKVCSKKVVELNRHMLVHSGYKHRCEFRYDNGTVCDILFRSKSRLNEHIDVAHKNFKKWLCKHCDAPFSRSQQLNIHIRAVHLNYKITCIVPGCNSIFTAKKSMAAHLKMVHKDLNEKEKKIYAEKIRKIPLPKIE